MIKSVHFKTLPGYLDKIKALQRNFVFNPGLNVVMGENGCGKTSLLKLLSAITGSTPSIKPWEPRIGGLSFGMEKDRSSLAQDIVRYMIHEHDGTVDLDLVWTGLHSIYYHGATAISMPLAVFEMEDVQRLWQSSKMSSGQGITASFNGFVQQIKKVKDQMMLRDINEEHNHVWQDAVIRWNDWVKENSNKCTQEAGDAKITLLADEPDAHMSIKAQVEFWDSISKIDWIKYEIQAIFVSHSCIVPSKISQEKIINMTPNFSQEIYAALKDAYATEKIR